MTSANISDDVAGWNDMLNKLKSPPETNINEFKEYLELNVNEKGNWAIQKNAIRVLYLYNEFLKFYAECTNGNVPAGLRGYLRTKNEKRR